MDMQLIERMKAAIEGECDGLAIDDAHAAAILDYVLDGYLARIDAERGKSAVHWRGVLDADQVPQQLNASLHVVGFRKLRDAESFVTSKLDLDGLRYTLEPLFLSPTIPEGMALVPIEPTVAMIEAGNEGFRNPDSRRHTVSSCYKAMIAAAQGERNAD